MNNEMIEISYMFLKTIKQFPVDSQNRVICDPNYKREVMNDVGEILAGGSVTPAEFLQLISDQAKETNKMMSLLYKPYELLEKKGITVKRKSFHDPTNLLQPGQFYYHPALQVVPPAPVLSIEDDGTMKASYEEEGDSFYLEIIEKITEEDLVRYFYAKSGYSIERTKNVNRDVGSIKHLLKMYEVDLILYMIDEAFTYSVDTGQERPDSILSIQHYEESARNILEARKITLFEEGLDVIRPKRS